MLQQRARLVHHGRRECATRTSKQCVASLPRTAGHPQSQRAVAQTIGSAQNRSNWSCLLRLRAAPLLRGLPQADLTVLSDDNLFADEKRFVLEGSEHPPELPYIDAVLPRVRKTAAPRDSLALALVCSLIARINTSSNCRIKPFTHCLYPTTLPPCEFTEMLRLRLTTPSSCDHRACPSSPPYYHCPCRRTRP